MKLCRISIRLANKYHKKRHLLLFQGPAAFRAALINKAAVKPPPDYVWMDDQTQPLPRSVRQYLHGWVRAEDLATERWEVETVVFEVSGLV